MRLVVSLLILSILLGCASTGRHATLYDELGGEQGIEKIVDGIIVKVQQDESIAELFEFTNFEYFGEKLFLQLCQLADGPCKYDGLEMSDAHLGMEISEAEFNHFTQDVIDVMDDLNVPIAAQNDLLSRLIPMRPDVIYQ